MKKSISIYPTTTPKKALRYVALISIFSCVVASPQQAAAVDGVSVSVQWEGEYDGFFGGFGAVWRHEISGNLATNHTLLHPGPARMVVISADGSRVAFIKEGGTIATMSIHGGEETDLIATHQYACLDWPSGDWIYYNLGGFGDIYSSKYLRRVNAVTGADEAVTEFSCAIWRFHISRDLKRAVVRDVDCFGAIVAYDLETNNGVLQASRATDEPSCGAGLDPEGAYFIDGFVDHSGIDIRRWHDLTIVESLVHDTITAWGGPQSGDQHDRNAWSANSQKWMCIHLGWGIGWDPENGWHTPTGANQVLYNWVDQERIVVTSNTEGSHKYDSAGDFWVGTPPMTPTVPDGGYPDAGESRDVVLVNQAPTASAGADQTVDWQHGALLMGTAEDDGRLTPEPLCFWEATTQPHLVTITDPESARTMVTFSQEGVYEFVFYAYDGEYLAEDTVTVTAVEPKLEMESPNGGEVWKVGDTKHIKWNATFFSDVTLSYSTNGGDNWKAISFSVDRTMDQWGNYAWEIPNTPSTNCIVSIAPYNDSSTEVRSAAPFEIRAPGPASEDQDKGCGCGMVNIGFGGVAGLLLYVGYGVWRRQRRIIG